MSQQFTNLELPAEEWSPVRWAFHVWSWIALLVLFVLLEVFVDPLTASLVLCLKLGWRDLLVAMRLRTLRHARLAGAIGFFCLAQACFKVALAGILVGIAVVGYEALLGVPQPAERFLAGLLLLFSGLALGTMLVLFAAARCCQNHVRGWLDGTIYEHLLQPRVPLSCRGSFNRVPWLLRIGFVLISLLLWPGPIVAVVMVVARGNFAGLPIGLLFSAFWWWSVSPLWTALKGAARTPQECWD